MIKTENRIICDNFDVEQYRYLTEERKTLEDYSACYENPLLWNKAKNFSIYDNQGNKWIDLTSGIFVANAGHSNPKIKKAIQESLDNDLIFSFCYNNEIRIKFLKKLLAISPSHFDKVILMNSGSEAMDISFKLIQVWGKQFKQFEKKRIVSFRNSYHGRGLAGHMLSKSREYSYSCGVYNDTVFLNFPYNGESFDERQLPHYSTIAAFVIETYEGWSANFYPKKYIQDLYTYAKKNNILVVFDEIQSGFYRTGKLYGYQHYGEEIKPDIVCLGKGISSSLPMAAVLSRKEIVDVDKDMDYSGTHPGDPICCAAALANLEFLENKLFKKLLKKKIEVFEKIKEFEKYKVVEKVNVKGMVAGILFDSKEIADKIAYKCINRGVLPVYTSKRSIKLGPPLTISIDAINEAFEVIEQAIKEENEHF